MRTGLIYIIKNKVNNKVYIGQTKLSIKDRWDGHLKRYKQTDYKYKLYNAMRKHGIENFFYEVLEENIPIDELDQKERDYIKKFDSYYHGYNSTKGGDGQFFEDFDEGQIIALYLSGIGSTELAKIFDVSWRTIIRVLDKYGIERNKKSYIDEDEFTDLYIKGTPLQEIADYFGVDIKTVGRRRNKLNLPKRLQREGVETN